MSKVTLSYNCDIRNNGTAVLVWDALKRGLGIGDLDRFTRPYEGPFPESELNIMIDDGRDDIDWVPPKPNAYWAIDTHLGYDRRLEWAKGFDYVFTAQKAGAAQMLKDGIKNAFWLPLACHPPAMPNLREMMLHPQKDEHCGTRGLDKQHDCVFVGFLNDGHGGTGHNRIEHLDRLFKEFPNSWLTFNTFFEDMAVRYIRGRLGFNVSILYDLNMRFFEIPCTGTAMLTNLDVEGWEELGFENGVHFIGYDGIEDMVEQARWGLQHPQEREEIAQAGHDLVREKHTYCHRMIDMLDTCGVKV